MALIFCPLFSGSSGNATFIGTESGGLLVDAGVSGKRTLEALRWHGIPPELVHAILVTHEHIDHVSGAGTLARRLGVPVYATEGTWDGMPALAERLPAEARVRVRAGESFYVGALEASPFATPHDANESVGYRVFAQGRSVAVATDLGHFSWDVQNAVLGADAVLLESNHDEGMLRRNPRYPATLKRRILGKRGHLSNDAGAEAALRLIEAGARRVLLGHLSRENNTPETALRTVRDYLSDAGVDVDREVSLGVACRDEAGFAGAMNGARAASDAAYGGWMR